MDPVKLSPTSIRTLLRCGQQYFYRYVEGLRRPPSVKMVVGTAVDHAANVALIAKARREAAVSPEAAADIAASVMRGAWENPGALELDAEERKEGRAATRGASIDRAVRLAKAFALRPLQAADPEPETPERPIGVQRWYKVQLSEGLILRGRSDLEETGGAVVDLKTSSRMPNADAAETSDQLSAGALARRVLDGAEEIPVRLEVLVDSGDARDTSPDAVRYVRLESRRDRASAERIVALADRAAEIIRAGAFTPAPDGSWWCSERFCGYAPICPFFRRPASVTVGSETLRPASAPPGPPKPTAKETAKEIAKQRARAAGAAALDRMLDRAEARPTVDQD